MEHWPHSAITRRMYQIWWRKKAQEMSEFYGFDTKIFQFPCRKCLVSVLSSASLNATKVSLSLFFIRRCGREKKTFQIKMNYLLGWLRIRGQRWMCETASSNMANPFDLWFADRKSMRTVLKYGQNVITVNPFWLAEYRSLRAFFHLSSLYRWFTLNHQMCVRASMIPHWKFNW